jgi:hypothetical protein
MARQKLTEIRNIRINQPQNQLLLTIDPVIVLDANVRDENSGN